MLPKNNVEFTDKKKRNLSFDRVTAFIKEAQNIYSEWEVGQREATIKVEPEYPELPIVVLLASDIHYGSMGVNYELLEEHLKIVEDTPNFYMATNGDHVDFFNAVKHATGMEENPISPQIQARTFVKKLKEIDDKSKMLFMSHGNHDDFGKIAGQDFYDSFLSEFKSPIFTSGGVANVGLGEENYRFLFNHTYWGRSKINVTNAAKRMMEYEGGGDCDIAWLGHTHQSSYEHLERSGKDILAIVSGSYKEKDNWARKKGIAFKGQNPGLAVMLWGKERRMEAFKDIKSAEELMTACISAYKKR